MAVLEDVLELLSAGKNFPHISLCDISLHYSLILYHTDLLHAQRVSPSAAFSCSVSICILLLHRWAYDKHCCRVNYLICSLYYTQSIVEVAQRCVALRDDLEKDEIDEIFEPLEPLVAVQTRCDLYLI